MQTLEIKVVVRPVNNRKLADWFQPLDGDVFPQLVHPYRWRRGQGHSSEDADYLPDFRIWGLFGARDKRRGDRYTVTVVVKRMWMNIFINFVVAMLLTSVLGMSTFFMEEYQDQMATLVTALLSVVTIKLQLRDELPYSPSPSAIEW